jgi:hypothetical protein
MTKLSAGGVIVLHIYDVKLVTAFSNIQMCCIKLKLFGNIYSNYSVNNSFIRGIIWKCK